MEVSNSKSNQSEFKSNLTKTDKLMAKGLDICIEHSLNISHHVHFLGMLRYICLLRKFREIIIKINSQFNEENKRRPT